MTIELDPRWEWVNVPTLDDPDRWVRGACRHAEVVPVSSVEGEVVARLCLTCDRQFDPADPQGRTLSVKRPPK